MNWFLIGFSGSGKTTLGKLLAESIGYDFLDMDALIEQREKQSITSIFETKGEQYFRNCESFYLKHLPISENRIIATGGGTPCFNENIEWMKLNGKVIYLKVDETILYSRLAPIKDGRALLKAVPIEKLQNHISIMLQMREVYYLKADDVVNIDNDIETTLKALKIRVRV